ncbi:MAG TPA: two-component sensor histidine kinase [Acidimicrobiaceae bacterium]|nr:two-component sensor histidine kinase [Acidimicrobiaceae bacterium]HCB37113.1 two-component sensor histidine kinase [Acidimicrobiaceae bacterium]
MSRLPLRARVVGLFTLGAALAAVVLIVLTYGLTRESLLHQRQDSSRSQFFANARQVQASLRAEGPDFAVLLESLPSLAGSRPIVWTAPSTWRAPSLTPGDLPPDLVEAAIAASPALEMRYRQEGVPLLALGLRLRPAEVSQISRAAYFEVVPLVEIEDTLGTLRLILLLGGAVTVVGGAGIGIWASRRLLRPLADISAAAKSISQGRFETRVESSDDPDLADIVNSFNAMAATLERRIARDARFASDVSHELRSPLQTLRSSIAVLMRRRDELDEPAATALGLLSDDVDRFEQLVKDLLDISRADAAEGGLPLTLVNVADLVRHSVETIDHELSLAVEPDDGEFLVMGDKLRLAQVLDNLLRNAEKYGDGTTRVEVTRSDGSVRIAVEDDGPGVAPSERELVFERFTRGAAARKRGGGGGAGLGLALVFEHTRRHGGSARVESKTDGSRGARFVVELPLARSP